MRSKHAVQTVMWGLVKWAWLKVRRLDSKAIFDYLVSVVLIISTWYTTINLLGIKYQVILFTIFRTPWELNLYLRLFCQHAAPSWSKTALETAIQCGVVEINLGLGQMGKKQSGENGFGHKSVYVNRKREEENGDEDWEVYHFPVCLCSLNLSSNG